MDAEPTQKPFTIEDLDAYWNDYPKERLIDILNGDYDLNEARDDLRSLIGTKYDTRSEIPNN
jgi:hypothetical protein